MPWKQVSTSPHVWQRPLGENERMIKWLGGQSHPIGKDHWAITASARMRLSGIDAKVVDALPSFRALQQAWLLLRFHHPDIATVAGSEIVEYTIPEDEATKWLWLDETLHMVSDASTTVDDVIASLKPSKYTVAFFLPHAKQFVLSTAHWRTDGFGILHLLNDFFDALSVVVGSSLAQHDGVDIASSLPWGQERTRLHPNIEEVLSLPSEPTEEICAASTACLATGGFVKGSVGVPWQDVKASAQHAGGTRGIRRTLSTATTKAVLESCATKNVRLLAAAHASLAKVNFLAAAPKAERSTNGAGANLYDSFEPSHYTSTMRFSLRPYLPSPFGSATYAATLYTGGYLAKVSSDQSWQDWADFYESQYAKGLAGEFLIARREYARRALKLFQQASGAGTPPRSEIDISSVGDAEKLIAPRRRLGSTKVGDEDVAHLGLGIEAGISDAELEVEDISVGVECAQRESYLFLWTFRGHVELYLVYNSAFYEAKYMEGLLHQVEATLLTELGVS
ncbi:hypothetical protein MGU_11499 [Metarhizium guizhouense ARSEF 977]|uniref:Uncharacterized protein n=1 Tax=Metarhizium guizhouense (strain ARSEF 977) TaxID=1276136 RepID=A0A0B4GN32_METGA|nr:hypothetical protein MGU_11499 [Metarhizium guizhouense ARSEF 977]